MIFTYKSESQVDQGYERFLKIQSGSLRFAKSLAINRLKKLKLYGYPMPFNIEKALAADEDQRRLLE